MTPEARARQTIDTLLTAAGWHLCDVANANVRAATNLTLYPPGTLLLAMYGEGKTRGRCTELRLQATTNQAFGSAAGAR